MERVITYKLDMEALSRHNRREVLRKYLRKELQEWELTKKSYAKKGVKV